MELVKQGLSLALEHELTDGGGRRLPAPRDRLRDRRRLRERARGAVQRPRPLPDHRRPRARGGLRRLHGLRAARARRVAADDRALPRADRRARGRRRPHDRRRRARLHPRRARRARSGPPPPDRGAGAGAPARHLLDAGRLRRLAGAGRRLRQRSGARRSSAAASCSARWEQSEDHHYAVWGLRLAASLFAQAGPDRGGARLRRRPHPDRDQLRARRRAGRARPCARRDRARARASRSSPPSSSARAVELHRDAADPGRAGADPAPRRRRAGGRRRARAGDRAPRRGLSAGAQAGAPARSPAVPRRRSRRSASRPSSGSAARAADGEGSPLTRRELEVVRLVADGRTNREIAAELFLSPRTVDMHVRNILAKLDCRSRVEASIKAGEAGLLKLLAGGSAAPAATAGCCVRTARGSRRGGSLV